MDLFHIFLPDIIAIILFIWAVKIGTNQLNLKRKDGEKDVSSSWNKKNKHYLLNFPAMAGAFFFANAASIQYLEKWLISLGYSYFAKERILVNLIAFCTFFLVRFAVSYWFANPKEKKH